MHHDTPLSELTHLDDKDFLEDWLEKCREVLLQPGSQASVDLSTWVFQPLVKLHVGDTQLAFECVCNRVWRQGGVCLVEEVRVVRQNIRRIGSVQRLEASREVACSSQSATNFSLCQTGVNHPRANEDSDCNSTSKESNSKEPAEESGTVGRPSTPSLVHIPGC